MKNVGKLIAFAIVAIGLSACGINNPNQAGQNGYYNAQGQWVQSGLGMNGTGNNCIIAGQPANLMFSAQGAFVNTAVILAGTLPQNSTRPGQYGQVSMGTQQSFGGGLQLVKQSTSGQMQLSVGQGFVSGTIALSGAITGQLAGANFQTQQFPYNQNFNQNFNQQQICVTSIGLDAVYSATPNQSLYQQQSAGYINQALVYLTLSTGQTVGPIPFY